MEAALPSCTATDFVILLQKDVVTDAVHAKKVFPLRNVLPSLNTSYRQGNLNISFTPAILCFATDQDSFTVTIELCHHFSYIW